MKGIYQIKIKKKKKKKAIYYKYSNWKTAKKKASCPCKE